MKNSLDFKSKLFMVIGIFLVAMSVFLIWNYFNFGTETAGLAFGRSTPTYAYFTGNVPAMIYNGNTFIGYSSNNIKLNPGTYTFTIKHNSQAQGYQYTRRYDQNLTVQINSSRTNSIRYVLSPMFVFINVTSNPPGAKFSIPNLGQAVTYRSLPGWYHIEVYRNASLQSLPKIEYTTPAIIVWPAGSQYKVPISLNKDGYFSNGFTLDATYAVGTNPIYFDQGIGLPKGYTPRIFGATLIPKAIVDFSTDVPDVNVKIFTQSGALYRQAIVNNNLQLELYPGTYKFEYSKPGYFAYNETLQLNPSIINEKPSIMLKPIDIYQVGILNLSSSVPNLDVVINGNYTGYKTPVIIPNIRVGNVNVRLEELGTYNHTQNLKIEPNDYNNYNLTVVKLKGQVNMTAPLKAGQWVYVDGKPYTYVAILGAKPIQLQLSSKPVILDLEVGTHIITFNSATNSPVKVVVRANEITQIKV